MNKRNLKIATTATVQITVTSAALPEASSAPAATPGAAPAGSTLPLIGLGLGLAAAAVVIAGFVLRRRRHG